jgi:regulator of sigma E protease
MTHLIDLVRNGGAFVVVLGILVFVHELGHYLAARSQGMHVEAFSIGFGPKIFGWTDRVGTLWKVSWLPLGGYVKLHGQERPEDVAPEVRAAWKPGRTFHGKSVGSRAIVIAAGPIANFLLATVLFSALFMAIGRPVPTAGPVVGDVSVGSAGEKAGLLAGDRIEIIDGTPIGSFEDLRRVVSGKPGQTVALSVRRGGEVRSIPATIDSRKVADGGAVGVLGVRGATEYQPVGPLQAIATGAEQTWTVSVATLQGLGQMLSGSRTTDELSGPLGIAQLSGQVAQLGIISLISFIAVLSVNLGLINLFPIPVLDGGYLVIYAAEAIRGRPLPQRLQEYGFRAGFALLAGLFVFATWNDLSRLGLFRWVSGLIG